MKQWKKAMFGAVAGSLLFATPQAFADDDTGAYLGVTINRLSADFEDENDVNFEDSDSAGGFRVGYMFTDMFGAEFGYLDLGNFTSDGDGPFNRIELDGDAFSIAFVANFSVLDQLDLYGKAGAYSLDVNATSTIAGRTFQANDTETAPFAAFGVDWDLGNFNLFGEISVVDTDISELTVDIATAGVKYEF